MAKQKKTAFQAIISTIKRGPKKGLTAVEVSERAGTQLNTTRAYLSTLKEQGEVIVVDTERTGRRGRPALRYTAA